MPTAPEEMTLKVIAHIHTAFPTKFGIPRQSGLVEALRSTIVFEPEFRNSDALRGIEDFSHLWLIWQFSEAVRQSWSPTVRPPRLGGNTRMGVFATRSPFRPNNLGLSSVRLLGVERHPDFRHQALHSLWRLPPGRHRRLHRHRRGFPAERQLPARASVLTSGGQAGRRHRRSVPRPPAILPAKPGARLRTVFRRVRYPLHRGG